MAQSSQLEVFPADFRRFEQIAQIYPYDKNLVDKNQPAVPDTRQPTPYTQQLAATISPTTQHPLLQPVIPCTLPACDQDF